MGSNENATANPDTDRNIKCKATLDAILLTNQQGIHYDESPAVYVTRKSDLTKWKKAFPGIQVIMYRLDVPRECRGEVTQVLDGYGPWGWDESSVETHVKELRENARDNEIMRQCGKFVETGRPLTVMEWDDNTKSKVFTQGELPLDDQEEDVKENNVESISNNNEFPIFKSDDDDDDDDVDTLYSPEAIRQREEKYRLLAVYTPGHTFGSVTYVFPQRGICCSGYALPLESYAVTFDDNDYGDDNEDDDIQPHSSFGETAFVPRQGPRLDYQGYLATSSSRPRQMSSALTLINKYIDRFRVVLPARGDVVFLDSDVESRKKDLMESVGLYRKIGDIYERLGIIE